MTRFLFDTEERLDWQTDASCAQIGGDAWFPEPGDPGTAARIICSSCPVQQECLDYALQERIEHGLWGGRSPNERKQLQRARKDVRAS